MKKLGPAENPCWPGIPGMSQSRLGGDAPGDTKMSQIPLQAALLIIEGSLSLFSLSKALSFQL